MGDKIERRSPWNRVSLAFEERPVASSAGEAYTVTDENALKYTCDVDTARRRMTQAFRISRDPRIWHSRLRDSSQHRRSEPLLALGEITNPMCNRRSVLP